MKHELWGENQEKVLFSELDSIQSRKEKSLDFKYHGKLIFEVLDSLFREFCANAFSI